MNHVVVLGGGYAGLLAATRSVSPKTRVTLIDARDHFTHRIRLHEALAGREVRQFDYAPMLQQQNINFMQARAEGLDAKTNSVMLRRDDGRHEKLEYDVLINALGSSVASHVAGVSEHSLRLNDRQGVQLAHEQIVTIAKRGGHVLIVGGGLTAIETASELAFHFPSLKIMLATSGALAQQYSDAARAHFHAWFDQHRVTIRDHVTITALEANQAWLNDGTSIMVDACVWSAGFAPSSFAREAGLAVYSNGQMQVLPTLQTPNHANIFGAGDATGVWRGDHLYRMACATAMPMGVHAANNVRRLLNGTALQPFALDYVAHNISLGRRDGVVQWVHANDAMRETATPGRSAAWIKEAICRAVMGVELTALRTGTILFGWAKRDSARLGARGWRLEA